MSDSVVFVDFLDINKPHRKKMYRSTSDYNKLASVLSEFQMRSTSTPSEVQTRPVKLEKCCAHVRCACVCAVRVCARSWGCVCVLCVCVRTLGGACVGCACVCPRTWGRMCVRMRAHKKGQGKSAPPPGGRGTAASHGPVLGRRVCGSL